MGSWDLHAMSDHTLTKPPRALVCCDDACIEVGSWAVISCVLCTEWAVLRSGLSIKWERELLRGSGMLLPPERCRQRTGMRPPELGAVDDRIAAGTESDQQLNLRNPTSAVMDRKALPFPLASADLAGIAVPGQDPGTQAGKIDPVSALPRVARQAKLGLELPFPPTVPTPQGSLAATSI